MNEVEASVLLNKLSCMLAGLLEGSDGSSDYGSTGLGKFRGDECDTANVLITILTSETELRGQF